MLLLPALAACNRNPAPLPDQTSASPKQPDQAGSTDDPCGSARLQRYAGQPDSPQNRAAMVAAAATNPIRWLRPGDAVTQEYAQNRINILIDPSGLIRSIRCG